MKRLLAGLLAASTAAGGVALTAPSAEAATVHDDEWRGWIAMEETYDPSFFGVNEGQHVARVLYRDDSRTSMQTTWEGDVYWQYTHYDTPPCIGAQAHEFAGHGAGDNPTQVTAGGDPGEVTWNFPPSAPNVITAPGVARVIKDITTCETEMISATHGETQLDGVASFPWPGASDENLPLTINHRYTEDLYNGIGHRIIVMCMSRDESHPANTPIMPTALLGPVLEGGPTGVHGLPDCLLGAPPPPPPTNPCLANPVPCYAPLVKFHPAESTFPMSPSDFVSHSWLMFAHDWGCVDTPVAGFIDPLKLGTGGYTQQQASNLTCKPKGKTYSSNQMTRPGDDGKHSIDKRPKGLSEGEGFYLDLEDAYRLGDQPVAGALHSTLTYSYDPVARKITYWFMYGFNQGAIGKGDNVDRHEGEWERVSVTLNPDGTPNQMLFFAHECIATITRNWSDVQKTADGHPVVYAALGAHASYPNAHAPIPKAGLCKITNGKPGSDPVLGGQGQGDETADGGATWSTWESLASAATQPWYGFGGAWGEFHPGVVGKPIPHPSCDNFISCKANVTGPLGPPHKPLFSY